jgi:hypothetical protein
MERSWRVKLSLSSPGSCKNMQLRLLHCSPRKYAEQYLVVPYWALQAREFHVEAPEVPATYLSVRSPFWEPSTAAMHAAASSLRAKVT